MFILFDGRDAEKRTRELAENIERATGLRVTVSKVDIELMNQALVRE